MAGVRLRISQLAFNPFHQMNIPYRNPANAPVDSIPEGWRLLLEEEFPFKTESADGFLSYEIGCYVTPKWNIGNRWQGDVDRMSYITSRPLPPMYQKPPIPWYNPKNITQEQLQPELGWRFLVEGEASGTDCEWWADYTTEWKTVGSGQVNYVSFGGERTKRQLPSRDPDYFSEEYQVEVFKAWRSNHNSIELQLYAGDKWVETGRNIYWNPIRSYRIKPADPVYRDEPLTDYRVGEAVSLSDRVYVVVGVEDSHVQLEDGGTLGTSVSFQGMMERGAKIHRNGEWQKCLNRVEVKA